MKIHNVFALIVVLSSLTVGQFTQKKEAAPMKIKNVFALIVTEKLFECRDFYIKHFGFTVAFQSTIYIQLSVPSEQGSSFDLALMPPNHPFGEDYRGKFNGKGMYLTIEVADAAAAYGKLKAEGAPILYNLKNEDWGQRHFLTKDPGGMTIDIVESIEPAAGYYDKYQVR